MTLSKLTSKSRWMCIKPKADSLSFLIVERMYVFERFNTLNDLSTVALATGIVKRTHIIVSIDGYSAGFTISSVWHSVVGTLSQGIIRQRARQHSASLLKSSNDRPISIWYVWCIVTIWTFVICSTTRWRRYCAVHKSGFRISEVANQVPWSYGPETGSIAKCTSNVYVCRPDGWLLWSVSYLV